MGKFLGIHIDVPFKGDPIPESKFISDDFERLMFAPDPASGNPCSSLAYKAKGDDEISKYIREHYTEQRGTGTHGLVTDVDVDSALLLVPNFGEHPEDYMKRVSELIANTYESED